MVFEGILIGTLIIWVLTALIVVPLAKWMTVRELEAKGLVPAEGMTELPEEVRTQAERTFTKNYILADMLVLGLAGFLAGLMGFLFIGISFEARGWPGIIALVAGCIAGSALSGGV